MCSKTAALLVRIATTATAGPDPLTEYPGISVPGATTMVYYLNKNRLYIPGGPVMAIVDVSSLGRGAALPAIRILCKLSAWERGI